jgi:hypothetical protein
MIRGWISQTGQRHGVAYAEEFHVAVNGRSSSEDSDAEVAAPTVSTSTADA